MLIRAVLTYDPTYEGTARKLRLLLIGILRETHAEFAKMNRSTFALIHLELKPDDNIEQSVDLGGIESIEPTTPPPFLLYVEVPRHGLSQDAHRGLTADLQRRLRIEAHPTRTAVAVNLVDQMFAGA